MCRFDKSKGKLLTILCQNMSLKNYFSRIDTSIEVRNKKVLIVEEQIFLNRNQKLLNSQTKLMQQFKALPQNKFLTVAAII